MQVPLLEGLELSLDGLKHVVAEGCSGSGDAGDNWVLDAPERRLANANFETRPANILPVEKMIEMTVVGTLLHNFSVMHNSSFWFTYLLLLM